MKNHNLRLEDNQYDAIKVLARYQMRSMNAQIAFMLQEFLSANKSKVVPKQYPSVGDDLDNIEFPTEE